eukprot:6192563-Pleurochrysis_carterae.AAC.3
MKAHASVCAHSAAQAKLAHLPMLELRLACFYRTLWCIHRAATTPRCSQRPLQKYLDPRATITEPRNRVSDLVYAAGDLKDQLCADEYETNRSTPTSNVNPARSIVRLKDEVDSQHIKSGRVPSSSVYMKQHADDSLKAQAEDWLKKQQYGGSYLDSFCLLPCENVEWNISYADH